MDKPNYQLIQEFEYRLEGYKAKVRKHPTDALFIKLVENTEKFIDELKKKG